MVNSDADVDGDRLVSEVIVSEVAKAKGVSPTQLRTPLYETVDPDALNCLLESNEGNLRSQSPTVQFSFHGFVVQATSDRVSVTEKEDGKPST